MADVLQAFLQFFIVLIAGLAAVYYSGNAPLLVRKVNEVVHGKPGCNPVPDLSNVTLHYFAVRGRGEVIRLILEEAAITYNETKFTADTWQQAKAKGIEQGLYTFGQVPVLTTSSGFSLAQSHAIAHYIGQASGMDCNCEDYNFCEMVALGVEDFRVKLSKVLYDPNFSVKMRNDYIQNIAPIWLQYFEKLAPKIQAQNSSFFASERLTWIDFMIFDLLDYNVEFASYDLGQPKINILESFSKLSSFYNLMKQRPRTAQYLKSNRRASFNIPNSPK